MLASQNLQLTSLQTLVCAMFGDIGQGCLDISGTALRACLYQAHLPELLQTHQ